MGEVASFYTASRFRLCAGLAFWLLVFILACCAAPATRLNNDSRGYLEYAHLFTSGQFFVFRPIKRLSQNRLMRPPLYPLMLAVSERLAPPGLDSIRLLHAVTGALTLAGGTLLMATNVPVWAAGGIFSLVFYLSFPYFNVAGTEWSAICAVLLLLAAAHRYVRNGSTFSLGLCVLLAAFATLLRVSHVICFIVPFALLLLKRSSPRQSAAAFILGVFPLVFWLIVNWIYIGHLTVGAALGVNIMGGPALIGRAVARPDDDARFRLFLSEVARKQSVPVSPAALCLEKEDWGGGFRKFDYNIWDVAVPAARRLGLDPYEANGLMIRYALRIIEDQPLAYFGYVCCMLGRAVQNVFSPAALAVYSACALLFLLGRVRFRPAGLFTRQCRVICGLSLLLHCAHTALCAITQQSLTRYHDMTFFPFLGSLLLYGLTYSGISRPPGRSRR